MIIFGFSLYRLRIRKTGNKINSILNVRTLNNILELRSQLSLINCYGRFISQLATIIELMTKRLHKDTAS